MTEDIKIDYPRGAVGQITPWSCGAAAAETVLAGCGITVHEQRLIQEIGTHTGGTDDVSLITKVLNRYLPKANYRNAYYQNDPPTKAQRDEMWRQLVHSITNGYGVVMNWWSPVNNRPAGTKGSVPPNYGNTFVRHYVAAMGISEKDRAVWVADSGFQPSGYWCPFEGRGSVSSLIPPKGIGWADCVPVTTKPEPPKPAPVDFTRTDQEWRATQFGDQDAVAAIVAAAKVDNRGRAALALLERVNPAALQAFITKG